MGVGSIGFHSVLKVRCNQCESIVTSEYTSELLPPTGLSAFNLRAVVPARNVGIGYSQLVKFFSSMNMPKPMHLKTYQSTAKMVSIVFVEL